MRACFVALALAALLLFADGAAVVHSGGNAQAEEVPGRGQVSAGWITDKVNLAQLFDSVLETVDQNFFDPSVLKQSVWQERVQAARSLVLDSKTADDAVRQINKLLAELGASHTALYTPDDYEFYILLTIVGSSRPAMVDMMKRRFWGTGPYYPGTGVFTRNVDGRNFVDGVLEGSPAEKAGLRFGDEILSVDGRPYSPVQAFQGKMGTTAELLVRHKANDEPELLAVPVIPIRALQAFSDATETSARVFERNGSRIGYIHVWELAESISFANALRAISGRTAKALDSLIVDLRGRVGGNMGVASDLLQDLDSGRSYWGSSRFVTRAAANQSVDTAQMSALRGRSALLIDAHTRSAGEIMAYGFKHSAFGPLLGTRTAGAVLSGALYPMPGDTVLYLAVDGVEIDGHRLEGAGVAPDYRVERPLPYAQGADPVLEAAADLLSRTETK
jgi:carboxyl-terminal processing protease